MGSGVARNITQRRRSKNVLYRVRSGIEFDIDFDNRPEMRSRKVMELEASKGRTWPYVCCG